MKLHKSKLLTFALSVPVAAFMLGGSSFAASSISSTVGGVSVSGSISKFANGSSYGATASTTCGSTLCTSYASVTYNYVFGDVNDIKHSSASASNTVSAYATAYSKDAPVVFKSATGSHSISYTNNSNQNFTWSGSTNI
ncbi:MULTISPECIES: hypothetical protein [Paenibacillus]|uniref:hypothetical protein n=1 Tax=Paenibacillus TaxID=44249 RepID=UPI000FD901A5|nr:MULTISPECIES: hypothetical protein [Paenibacillus]